LAPHNKWQHITTLFLKQFPDAYFHHITEEYAELLHDLGYYINSAGSETTLQVLLLALLSSHTTPAVHIF
jgi:hypothetical protein